ncbi:MAG: ribosome assembly cofactor RimP [Bacteroidaceae bacterium]|nr:ribosome assembly cofactor RimP [Prevotellaceae bacterium]MDY5631580.1 ribosome assembly cofactor RimP [Bacteroidaceae bacterium]
MIDKKNLEIVVNEWLEKTDYFLVDLSVSSDDRIVVVIDHAEGVWIEDCVALSRFIEERFDREEQDYELEVGSAGLGQPFMVHRQWEIHIGDPVETQMKDGHKYMGELTAVDETGFNMLVEMKVKAEGAKRAKKEMVDVRCAFADVAYTKYLIKVK